MKKYSLIIMISIVLMCISCAKDNLYEDALMGKWDAYSIEQDGKWIGIPNDPNKKMSITIDPNGTYSSSGYLGKVSGKWHLSKRNLTFYDGEKEYMTCYVSELWWDECELKISLNDEIMHVKFKCNK